MNREKVAFAFFIVLALTVNFGFFMGDIDNPEHHNVFEFFAAMVVSLIATVLNRRGVVGYQSGGGSTVGDCRLCLGLCRAYQRQRHDPFGDVQCGFALGGCTAG